MLVSSFRLFLLVLVLVIPVNGNALPYSDIFVFGDSLSDTGNLYLALGDTTPTPISDNGFIPSLPYDRGSQLLPALSNGPTWIELLADDLQLSLTPSLLGGNNYAFGGARMAPTGDPSSPPSIQEQVDTFISGIDISSDKDAPADALYSVWGGGNDARDAAVAVLTSGNPDVAFPFISAYVDGLADSIQALAGEGATHILVPNIPDIGKTPALLAAGPMASAAVSGMTAGFNFAADSLLTGLESALEIDLIRLDTFSLINNAVLDPQAYGLDDISNACAVNPDCIAGSGEYFFWDGIHPTATGHAIISQAVPQDPVPEPATMLLLVPGLAATLMMKRRFNAH